MNFQTVILNRLDLEVQKMTGLIIPINSNISLFDTIESYYNKHGLDFTAMCCLLNKQTTTESLLQKCWEGFLIVNFGTVKSENPNIVEVRIRNSFDADDSITFWADVEHIDFWNDAIPYHLSNIILGENLEKLDRNLPAFYERATKKFIEMMA